MKGNKGSVMLLGAVIISVFIFLLDLLFQRISYQSQRRGSVAGTTSSAVSGDVVAIQFTKGLVYSGYFVKDSVNGFWSFGPGQSSATLPRFVTNFSAQNSSGGSASISFSMCAPNRNPSFLDCLYQYPECAFSPGVYAPVPAGGLCNAMNSLVTVTTADSTSVQLNATTTPP